MITRERRNKLMEKMFYLCKIQTIDLEHEPGGIPSSFPYISIEDQLIRILSDPEVFQQYLKSGRRNTMYDQNGPWFGDFFQSDAYQEILWSLPEGSDPFPPILIGLYR